MQRKSILFFEANSDIAWVTVTTLIAFRRTGMDKASCVRALDSVACLCGLSDIRTHGHGEALAS